MNTIEDRFWNLVEKSKGCWLWKGSTDRHGYGQFKCNKVMKRAHRVAWSLAHGEAPEGSIVMHNCDERRCVRPDHLRLGTQRENCREMMERGGWRGNQFVNGDGSPRVELGGAK